MMLSLVGVGGAGCQIVESFYKKNSLVGKISFGRHFNALALDTSDEIQSLGSIPSRNKVLIGRNRTKGHGTGGDTKFGSKIIKEEIELVMAALKRSEVGTADVLFMVAGIGGGTGAGCFTNLANKIKKSYNIPMVGILILPSRREGALYTKNAQENFESIKKAVDGVIVLDNSVLASRGEDKFKGYRIIDEAVINFLNLVEPMDIFRIVKDTVSTIGFMTETSGRISIKELVDKMFRRYVYFATSKFNKIYLIVSGNMNKIYGQSYAQDWVKGKFGVEIDYIFKDDTGSKYLNAGLILTGIEGVISKCKVKSREEGKISSELEDLLGDIKPLY